MPQPPPPCPFEPVIIGSVSEAAFQKILSPLAVAPPGEAVGLLAALFQNLGMLMPAGGAASFGARALCPQGTAGAYRFVSAATEQLPLGFRNVFVSRPVQLSTCSTSSSPKAMSASIRMSRWRMARVCTLSVWRRGWRNRILQAWRDDQCEAEYTVQMIRAFNSRLAHCLLFKPETYNTAPQYGCRI